MSASLAPLTLEEFLAWETEQEERFEFDGVQPIPRHGAADCFAHALIVTRLIGALLPRLPSGCVPVAHSLKVRCGNVMRYPDLAIVRGSVAPSAEFIAPTIVFEVLSPSTALTDERVKTLDYAQAPSILAYVLLAQDGPRARVLRRAEDWAGEAAEGQHAALALPELRLEVPLVELYGR